MLGGILSFRWKVGCSVLLVLFASGVASASGGGEPAPNTIDETQSQPVPWLLGDWNGYRTRWQRLGIDLQLGYVGEFAYNAAGGTTSEAAYADQYRAGLTLDLARLFGLHDATFQITYTARTGRNLSDDAGLGTLQQVQEVFGRGQTGRLTQLWLDQGFFDGKLDWKFGRLTFGEDFASFPCDFENLTFCGAAPGNLVGNYIFNWPVSQWAARLRLNLEGFGYVQVGAYDVNPRYAEVDDTLLPVFFPKSTGVLLPLELAWLPKSGGLLPGSYKIGAWYDTSTADDVVSDINGNLFAITGLPPMQHQGRFGGYLSLSQQLTPLADPKSKGGLSAFFNAVVASDQTSTTDSQIATGLIYTGPFRSRPDDDVAFAIGMTRVNSRIANAELVQNALGLGPVAVQGAELAMELHYTLRPTNGLLFRPSLQYVVTPGGTSQNANALVLGFTTSMNF